MIRVALEIYAACAFATLFLIAWLDERGKAFVGRLRVAEAAVGAVAWPLSLFLIVVDLLVERRDRRRV